MARGRSHAYRPGRRRLARLVTEVLAPVPVVTVLVLLIAVHSSSNAAAGVLWGLLAVVFTAVLPFLYILRGVKRSRLTDHHVGVRAQRPVPLAVGVGSVLVGLALLAVLGAPRDLVALVGAMAAGLAVSTLVTLLWKISLHVAVASGAVAILVLVFGPALLALVSLVVLLGWARVEIGDHTPSQVVAGSVLGATVATTIFVLLR